MSPATTAPSKPAPRTDSAPRRSRGLLAVIIATIVAFASSLAAGFVWDDLPLVRDNPRLLQSGALMHGFRSHVWDVGSQRASDSARFYRPLVSVFFVTLRRTAGLAAWPYHLAVLGLHLVAIVLCARLLRRVVGPHALAVTAGTTLFALHATRSDSVTWISGVPDVLAAIPALVALTLASSPRAPDARSTERPATNALLIAACTALGLLAKEAILSLPLAIALIAFVSREERSRGRAAALYGCSSGVVVMLYLVARVVWLPLGTGAQSPPFTSHVLLSLESLGRYVGALVWPLPLTFLPTTLTITDGAIRVAWPWSALGLLTVVALLALVARAVRTRRLTLEAAGIFITVALLAPVLNIVWIGYPYLVANRFLYVPIVGIAVAVAALVARMVPDAGSNGIDRTALEVRARRVGLIVVGFALIHGASIAVRALDFRSEYAFWASEVEMHPDVPLALGGLAAAEEQAGRPGRAFLLRRRAYELKSRRYGFADASAQAEMLFELVRTGAGTYPDDAVGPLEDVVRLSRDVLANRAGTSSAQVHGVAVTVQTGQLDRYLRTDAASVLDTLALTLSRLGRHDEAMREAHRAMARCGDRCANDSRTLAVVSARAGRWRESLDALAIAERTGIASEYAPLRATLERGARLAPDDAQGRARAQLDLGAPGLALAALAGAPPTPERARLVGEALLVEGHAQSARRWLERAGAISETDARRLREIAILASADTEGLPDAPSQLAPPPWTSPE